MPCPQQGKKRQGSTNVDEIPQCHSFFAQDVVWRQAGLHNFSKLGSTPTPWSGTFRDLNGTSMWRPQSRYTVSRIECRIKLKFPQNQRCRAKIALHPPKIKVSHLSPNPPVALSSHWQQAGDAVGWWRVSRHFWVPKTDRATRGYRSYSHTSRATLCN